METAYKFNIKILNTHKYFYKTYTEGTSYLGIINTLSRIGS